MANETRQKLFRALNDAGFDIGSYDDFDRRMNNAADRVKFYDAVQAAGYDIGGFGEFERRIKESKYSLNVNGKRVPVSEREYKDFVARHNAPRQAAVGAMVAAGKTGNTGNTGNAGSTGSGQGRTGSTWSGQGRTGNTGNTGAGGNLLMGGGSNRWFSKPDVRKRASMTTKEGAQAAVDEMTGRQMAAVYGKKVETDEQARAVGAGVRAHLDERDKAQKDWKEERFKRWQAWNGYDKMQAQSDDDKKELLEKQRAEFEKFYNDPMGGYSDNMLKAVFPELWEKKHEQERNSAAFKNITDYERAEAEAKQQQITEDFLKLPARNTDEGQWSTASIAKRLGVEYVPPHYEKPLHDFNEWMEGVKKTKEEAEATERKAKRDASIQELRDAGYEVVVSKEKVVMPNYGDMALTFKMLQDVDVLKLKDKNGNEKWVDSYGNTYDDKADAVKTEKAIAEAKWRVAHSNEYLNSLNEKEIERLDKEIEARYQAKLKEIKGQGGWTRLGKELMANAHKGHGGIFASILFGDDAAENELLFTDPEFRQLLEAKRIREENAHRVEQVTGDWGFMHTAYSEVVNLKNWDFGTSDLSRAVALLSLPEGKKLEEMSAGERALADAVLDQQRVEEEYPLTTRQTGGTVAGMAVPLAFAFGITGGFSGVYIGAEKGAVQLGKKLALEGMKKSALRVLGRSVDDIARGAVMATTVYAPQTAADAINRYKGEMTVDDDGVVRFDDKESLAGSIFHAVAAATGENATELWGETFIDPVLGKLGRAIVKGSKRASGAAGGAVTRLLGRGAAKSNLLGDVSRELLALRHSDAAELLARSYGTSKAVLRAGKINSIPGETLEEEFGNVWTMVTGNEKERAQAREDFVDPDKQLDLALTTAFSVGFMQLHTLPLSIGSELRASKRYKHEVDKADKIAGFRLDGFGREDGRWSGIKERIDNATNDEMKDVLLDIARNGGLALEEMKAVGNYAVALVKERGFNTAAMGGGEERGSKEEALVNVQMAEAYDGKSREEVETELAALREEMAGHEIFNNEALMSALENNPEDQLNFMRGGSGDFTEEERLLVCRYVSALKQMEAVELRERDDIDTETELARQMINRRVARREQGGDGMIHPATMKADGRQVYVVNGHVQMLEDGSMIDREASEKDLVVVDAQTGMPEFVSVDDLLRVDEAIDPQTELEAINSATPRSRDEGVESSDEGEGTKDNEQGGARGARGAGGKPVEPVEPVEQVEQVEPEEPRVEYAQDDLVTLRVGDETIRGQVSAEADEDGLIEVYTETPINGKKVNLFTREELDGMLVEHKSAEPRSSDEGVESSDNATSDEERVISEGITGAVEGLGEAMSEQAAATRENDINNWLQRDDIVQALQPYTEGAQSVEEVVERALAETNNEAMRQTLNDILRFDSSKAIVEAWLKPTEEQGQVEQPTEPMPMVGEGENAEPDFSKVTPERAQAYIYDEAGLTTAEADQFVAANIEAAGKALTKAKQKPPKMGTSIAKYRREQAEYQSKIDEAQGAVDYWNSVKAAQQARRKEAQAAAEAEQRRLTQEAIEQERQYQAEVLAKREEQERLGAAAVGEPIRKKWQEARKEWGFESERTMPNGERLKGRYVLTEVGAATPSHDWRNDFAPTEGYPVTENGESSNDRDYWRDRDAQDYTRQMAQNADSRFSEFPPIVDGETGVVLDGNGRTLAHDMAADMGTDGVNTEWLRRNGRQFGFTPEQVDSFEHPSLKFVPNEALPFTPETFAKFNQEEKKSQSKTEAAVKLGKIVDDATFGRIISSINGFDTLGDFYADNAATAEAIGELRNAGAISQMEYAKMFDGEGISASGRETLENMLIGKAFESNPDAIRQLTTYKSLRQSVIAALAEISNNIKLGKDYSLESELAEAIKLAYAARKNGGYKAGAKVSLYARQLNLFPFESGSESVTDYTNACILMLADLLNDNRVNQLKKTLSLYNSSAKFNSGSMALDFDAAEPGAGRIVNKEEIIKNVLNTLNYGTDKEQQRALAEATEQRKADAELNRGGAGVQQDGTPQPSNEGGGAPEGELADNLREQERKEKILPNLGDKYSLSTEQANNGELFYQNEAGSTTLATIPEEIFERLGITPVPFKLTETMGWHVFDHHAKECKFKNIGDAIDFVLSIINNVDHVRLGRDNSYIFSVEEGKNRTARRAITIMINSETGEFMGIRTSGYETLAHLKERPLLWERSAETVPEDVATPTITTINSQQGDEKPSRTKGQSNEPSGGKGSKKTVAGQKNEQKNAKKELPVPSDEELKGWSEADMERYQSEEFAPRDEALSDAIAELEAELEAHPRRTSVRKRIEALKQERKALGERYSDVNRRWREHQPGFAFPEEGGEDAAVNDERLTGNEHGENAGSTGNTGNTGNTGSDGKGRRTGKPGTKDEGRRTKEAEQGGERSSEYGASNKLVTKDRYEELKRQMRKKLNRLSMNAMDPEMIAIGAQLAVYHIEAGAKKFADYAKRMIEDLGDGIRPYLKSFYASAMMWPQAVESGLTAEMDTMEEVMRFDVANFDKPTVSALAAAKQVVDEQQVMKAAAEQVEAGEVSLDGTPLRKATQEDLEQAKHVYYKGKRYGVLMLVHHGEQVGLKFTKPEIRSVVLHDGTQVSPDELYVEKEPPVAGTKDEGRRTKEDVRGEKKAERGTKSEEKSVTSQSQRSLFGDEELEETNKDNKDDGLQRDDELRSGGLPSDRDNTPEPPRRLGEASGQESGRPDRGRESRGGQGLERGLQSGLRLDEQLSDSPSPGKNKGNNHVERGKDYAPKDVDARIEANIAAIELMQQLLESGRRATAKEMAVLRKFSGWGGLGKAFEPASWGYRSDAPPARLRKLLGDEAYEQAVMSRNSAYYTPAKVIDRLWDIARALGFKGGNVLEGSAGIGNILGLMPTDMSERSDIHAVEIDSTSGNILSLLYPEAKVEVQGFEATRVQNGSVDLAITNVPFVTGLRVNDITGDKDLSKIFHDIHDFCIAKNIRKLREGGIGIFITSSGTLDRSQKLRDWIVGEGKCDVVGAFRMNNATFGGTAATSDIIVVRKRVNGQKSAHAIDVSQVTGERTAKYDTGDSKKGVEELPLDYNTYFVEHPEMMGGVMQFGFERGDNYRPTSKGLYPKRGINQDERLSAFVEQLAAKDWSSEAPRVAEQEAQSVYEELGEGVREGSMVVDGEGRLCIASYGRAVPIADNGKKVRGHTKQECFKAYTAIKDALTAVLDYQTNNEGDGGLAPLLDKLNKAFDSFVKTYGHFHKNTAISFLRPDIDFSSIAALERAEEYNDATGKRAVRYGKSDIFSKRVVEHASEPHPTTVKDGVITSMYLHGRIDIPYISEQLNKSESEVKREIIDSGLGFEDPVSREVTVSYEYLSGNVREKLRQAEESNEDGQYNANIKALREVIPMDIPAHLIEFSLGSSWLNPKLYEEYIKARTNINVVLRNIEGTWVANAPEYGLNEEANRAMSVRSEMCDRTIWGHELIIAALQNRTISVQKTVKHHDGTRETIRDKEASQMCSTKIDEIRQDFKDWAREKMQSDPSMSEEVERIYNEQFNNYVPKDVPSTFIPDYFPGANHAIKLRPHQAKAAIRGTTQPLLLAHEVGSGKTFTLISTAMEMRRLGTARKPMIVVQNSTVGQVVSAAKYLYPNAKILTLEEADRTKEGRKAFYAKIRYNDWDMIVIPQSAFEMIPDSEERQLAFVRERVDEKMRVLEQMREAGAKGAILRRAEKELEDLTLEANGIAVAAADKRKARDAKKEAVARQNADVKAREMLDRHVDEVEDFDQMGVDAILVDEAHEYKHLGFATAMQRGVKGVDPSYSKKAQGVYLKCQSVLEKTGGKNVIFATGTPISNTAAEIWTFMRYLMPAETMRDYGIYYFDDFVRNFGNLTQMLEFTTSGKFKENNRFAGYVNLPELVRIWGSVSHTVLNSEVEAQRIAEGKESEIPELEGGKAQDIFLPQTRALRSIMKYVKSQLEAFDNLPPKEKHKNSHIPLTMYGIAQQAAIDPRLVLEDAVDDPNSKTNEAVRQTLRSLKETAEYKGTVAIFADHYQNKQSGFNLYEDIRKKLIAEGVPEEQIVVMKSGMTTKKKVEIFDKVNSGEVRVVLGSTFTLGTGVNIQERLHTLIHLDAPNRPMDYTQRNGRILRQGNLHKKWGKPVRVLRFGVEDSLDVTAYQRLKTKGAIADSIMQGKQLMSNSMENRSMEEAEDLFGDTVAQLSGSEYAMLKQQAEREVRKLEAKERQYKSDQTYIHNQKPRIAGLIEKAQARIASFKEALQKLARTDNEGGKIVIGKQQFSGIESMADFVKEYNKKLKDEAERVRGSYMTEKSRRELPIRMGGFDFVIRTEFSKEIEFTGGRRAEVVHRTMTYSCEALGLDGVPVKQSLLRNALEDITENVLSGKNFNKFVEEGEARVKKYEEQLTQMSAREGKPFEFADDLQEARERLADYEEKMKAELEAKDAKYAEVDAEVEEATDVVDNEEVEDDGEGELLFREDEDGVDEDTITGNGKDVVFSEDPAVQNNIVSGLNALERLASGETEVSDAMRRKELAELGGTEEISFLWGSPGHLTEAGRYKGGEGFWKIIEKHGIDDAIKVVETIAKGEIGTPYGVAGGQRVDIDFRDHHTTVSLFRHGESKSWVLTGYTIDVNTDAKGRGSDLSNATQNDPIRTRAELGAALKSAANIQRIFNTTNESGEELSSEDGILLREVDDENIIAQFDADEHYVGFRNVVLHRDGSYGSPMAGTLKGLGSGKGKSAKTSSFHNGVLEESEENPDLADENGKITLGKPDDFGDVPKVNYNPYTHNRLDMVNPQFKNAWERDNLVFIKTEVSKRDLESGYHAEKAHLPVGVHQWSGGPLMLSRYDRPVGIVPWETVAKDWIKRYKGKKAVNFDIVPPALLPILDAAGVEIIEPHKNMGKECFDAYNSWLNDKESYYAEHVKPIEELVDDPSVLNFTDESGKRHEFTHAKDRKTGEVVRLREAADVADGTEVPVTVEVTGVEKVPRVDYVTGEQRTEVTYSREYVLPDGTRHASLDAAAAELRKHYPEHAVFVNEDGKLEMWHWSSFLPAGTPINMVSKAAAIAGGRMDASKRRQARRWMERETRAMRERVNELGKLLGVKVRVVESRSELPAGWTERQKTHRKGWYNPRTGEVVVVLPNHVDAVDVEATMMHEIVGHKGLRALLGEDFNTFLDNVYRNATLEIKTAIASRAAVEKWRIRKAIAEGKRKEMSEAEIQQEAFRVGTEEYLAHLAETTDFEGTNQRWWQQVREWLLDALRKIGFNLPVSRISDNDLRYILWRSYRNLKHGGIMAEAEDVVMRDKLLNSASPKSRDEGVVSSERGAAEGPLFREVADMSEEEIKEQLNSIKTRHGLKSRSSTTVISSERDLEALKGSVEDEIYEIIAEYFRNPRMYGVADKLTGVVYIFPFKQSTIEAAEGTWWHESTHVAWADIDMPDKVECGLAALEWLRKEEPYHYQMVQDGPYNADAKRADEATARLVQHLVNKYGVEAFLNSNFDGNEKIAKLATAIQTYFKHGKEETNNRLQQTTTAVSSSGERTAGRGTERNNRTGQSQANDRGGAEGISSETLGGRSANRTSDGLTPEYGDTEDIWSDGSMGIRERMTAAAMRLSEAYSEDKTLRNDAMRAISSNLAELRKAMGLQRHYDRSLVKRVADLARVLITSGHLSGLSGSEVKRLLSAVKNSVGREEIDSSVQKVMDLMVDNQLKNAEQTLHALESTKGSKVDARGVEVQGQLDPAGAHILKVFKKVRDWEKSDITEAIADAQQRMGSEDTTVADDAAEEYAGLQLALQYAENIKSSKVEERRLRDEIKQAHDETDERDRLTESYRQYIASLQESIRQNKIERVEDYHELVGRLTGSLRASIANAKAFKEAEKQRIAEIHHNANSDMEGRPSNEHYKPSFKDKFVNHAFIQFLFAPLATFEQMLRVFGKKSANGEGYLYNRFMRGWVDARQKELRGVRSKYAILDAKAAELFGGKVKTWAGLIRKVGKLPKGTVSFWDGGEMREHELTQGNLMYIYMVNKMLDGRMKLRKMGITDEAVAEVKRALDPRLVKLADWLQDDFLVKTRNEYNKTHKRTYGASMAAIEHYFPLKILANARADKSEDLDNPERGDGISTATGSIIKRRRNTLALDLTGADALHLILDHVAKMEHWNAFAEYNRDLNTLRTYKRFRNQVQNMTTIYGSGKLLWKKFNTLCQITVGAYDQPRRDFDKSAVNLSRGATAAAVSFRLHTALKQLLSMPAYIPEVRVDHLASALINPVHAWKWGMKNLPIFEERWKSRIAGDPRLLKTDMDWKMWRSRVAELASRVGMSPNAFVDAVTVSIGAYSMYKTRLGQYLRDGYTQEDAERKAVQDVEVLYNQTQQSSEGPFLSPMQVDRSWLSTLFTIFRNSSMAYTRQLYDAVRNMKRNLTPGQRAASIAFMKKQYVRDGLDEVQAEANAKRKFRRQLWKDILRVGTFGYIVQLAWNLGAYMFYMLMGDDDDEKDKAWDDAWMHALLGGIEGLTGGDVLSLGGTMAITGEGNPNYLDKDMPVTGDALQMLQELFGGKQEEALADMINLVVKSGIGVNPQSITDGVLAIMDACGDDPALAHEASICIGRILQVPQSELDKLYFDEIGLSGSEVSNYTPAELAARYARYRTNRERFYSPWAWDDETALGRWDDKARTKMKERIVSKDDEALIQMYDANSDKFIKQKAGGELAKRMEGEDTYGRVSTDYGVVYIMARNYDDLAGDVALYKAQKEAKERGDSERAKAIDKARREITKEKKRLSSEASATEVKAIMEDIRALRRSKLDELGI